MSNDYNDRGIFHKVVNHTPLKLNKSKNVLIRNTAKTLLKAEKVSLIAKDIVTNKLVGKEFHIKFERRQNSHGKFHTKVSLVRADAPAYKQRGVLHRITNLNRRFEGDVPNALQSSKISKTAFSGAKNVALSSETIALTISSVSNNRLKQNIRNDMDGIDTGKAALSTVTAARTINDARKAAVQHRIKKASYKLQKQTLVNQKAKLSKSKNIYKTSLKDNKRYFKEKALQLQKIHKVYKNNKNGVSVSNFKRVFKTNIRLNSAIEYRAEKQHFEKKAYKNQKKAVKKSRKLKKYYRTKPLILTGAGLATVKITGRLSENIAKSDPDNDFVSAISKSARTARDVKSINRVVKNHKVEKTEKKIEKLNKRSNKLQQQKNKLHKKQKVKKSKTKPKNKPTPVKDKTKGVVFNFVKFIFNFFGMIAFPLLIIIFFFALILLMFGGGAENNTYILGTYNCTDYTMAQAINKYTEIAYNFNEDVMKCQSSSTWKNGLNAMGISTTNMSDVPSEFIFGRNSYQNYDPVYDFDYDKFIAFMCAYTYDFSTDNDDIKLWTYKSEYDEVIQDLFDIEYDFVCKYINTSHWVTVNSYTIYPSATQFWYVDDTGITTVSGVKYGYLDFSSSGLPSELNDFTSNKVVHFDLSTGEIKNRKKSYGKTGYYVQNLDWQYMLSTGSKVESFYKNVVDGSTGNTYKGFKIGNTWHHKTQLYVGSYAFNYAMAKEDVRLFVGNNSENRQLIRDFKQEEYVTECKLYTNVRRNKTFDEAIRYILNNQTHSSERIEFYETLLNADVETNGNHQMFNSSPLSTDFSTLISQGKIFNSYGYDIQKWNNRHCGIAQHDGIDIAVSSGTNVLSMIDGKIENIDTSKHTITVVTTSPLNYWYENNNNRDTKIIYENVTAKSNLHIGDEVLAGDIIGKVDNYKHCYNNVSNTSASQNYLHITVQIHYGIFGWDWYSVDPRFLIYLD